MKLSPIHRLGSFTRVAGAVLLFGLPVGAQSKTPSWTPSDFDPRQPVALGAGCGDVHFKIRCTLPENQRYFDRGIALLHGGAMLEAERSFRQVTATEPDVAMAY